MQDKLTIGRYIPYDSFVHRLDPRSKLLGTIFYFIMTFIANNWISYLLLVLLASIGIVLSRIPINYFIRGIRPMIWLITFTALLQVFFTPGITQYFNIGIVYISKEGLVQGISIFLRFLLLIVMSTLLTLTTKPLDLTDAIEFLFKPLKFLKFPVSDIALMLSISLRFIPTMFEEAEKIVDAQRSRGVNFEEGTLLEKIKNYIPILLPLFVSSYDRAPQLATAMEARGYRGGENRTKYRKSNWEYWDTLVLLTYLSLFFILLFIGR